MIKFTMTAEEAKKFSSEYDQKRNEHHELLGTYYDTNSTAVPTETVKRKIDALDNYLKSNKVQRDIVTWILLQRHFNRVKEATGLTKTLDDYLDQPKEHFDRNGIDDDAEKAIRKRFEDEATSMHRLMQKAIMIQKIHSLATVAANELYTASKKLLADDLARFFTQVELLDGILTVVAQRKDMTDAMRKNFITMREAALIQRFLMRNTNATSHQWRPQQIIFALQLIRNTYFSSLNDIDQQSPTKQAKLNKLDGLILQVKRRIEVKGDFFIVGDLVKCILALESGRIKLCLSKLQQQVSASEQNIDAFIAPIKPENTHASSHCCVN